MRGSEAPRIEGTHRKIVTIGTDRSTDGNGVVIRIRPRRIHIPLLRIRGVARFLAANTRPHAPE